MKKADVKIGMKVVPFRKTSKLWPGIARSVEWREGRAQGFLYVVEWEKEEKCWVLSARSQRNNKYKGGDFFNSSDFRPYDG